MTHPVYGTVVKLRAVKFNGIVISKNESKKKKTDAGYICVSRFRHATWLIKIVAVLYCKVFGSGRRVQSATDASPAGNNSRI